MCDDPKLIHDLSQAVYTVLWGGVAVGIVLGFVLFDAVLPSLWPFVIVWIKRRYPRLYRARRVAFRAEVAAMRRRIRDRHTESQASLK
jgi:hypothetical protein